MANWKKVKLEEVCSVEWGNSELTKASYIPDGEYLAVSAAGCDGRIGHREHAKNTPVISAIGANCGRMFLPREDFTAIKNTITITPVDEVSDGRYLYEVLTFTELPKRGGAQPFMSKGDIESFKIPLPPLAEQRKIAEILRTWDEAIETAEAELKAKRERKRWLISSLLNPTVKGGSARRMNNHPKVPVAKLGTLKKGGAILREKLRADGPAVLLYGDIYTKYAEIVTSFISRVDPTAIADGVRINTGDIVFAGSGETAEEIGKCIAYVGNEEAYAGGDVVILSNHGQDARYLGYVLNAEDAIRQKMRLGQGSSVMHLYKDDVGSIQILLPPLAEQREIAEILQSEADGMRLLESKVGLLRTQKRGLMQKLLAGEIRVTA